MDSKRRLGGALAAQRAVSDRSWIDLAACKERRRMELTLGHHGAILNLGATELRGDAAASREKEREMRDVIAGSGNARN